jgi:hypothetical protein
MAFSAWRLLNRKILTTTYATAVIPISTNGPREDIREKPRESHQYQQKAAMKNAITA